MSWMDINERTFLPRFIGRPPKPQTPVPHDPETDRASRRYTTEESREYSDALYRWEHAWELFYEPPKGGFMDLLEKGWEVRHIYCGRLMTATPDNDYKAKDRKRKDEVSRWADAWINGSPTNGLVWPEDREAVVLEVASRLQEAIADGFLLRSLEATK